MAGNEGSLGAPSGPNQQQPRIRVTMSLADMTNRSAVAAGLAGRAGITRGGERRDSFATSEEFVNKFDGKRAINKVLIANNGIAGTLKNCSRYNICISHT